MKRFNDKNNRNNPFSNYIHARAIAGNIRLGLLALFAFFAVATLSMGCGDAEGADNDESDSEQGQVMAAIDNRNEADNDVDNDIDNDIDNELENDNDKYSFAHFEILDGYPETIFADLTPDGSTVNYVDLERYLGRWYEIATYEQIFQRGCTGTTATYGLNDNGTISVKNECFVGDLDGRYKVANAYARVVDDVTNARLKVFFFPLFGAPYWVIELDGQEGDQPYQWAVVGSPTDQYLWILSRTPQVDDNRLTLILERLAERGYNLDELSFTLQPE